MGASEEVILYSCITDGRDRIKSLIPCGCRCVLFTDGTSSGDEGWEVFPLASSFEDPVLTARFHKHNPHLLFPGSSVSIWIDGTHRPYRNLLPLLDCLGENDIAACRHHARTTVAEEVDACVEGGIEQEEVALGQLDFYKQEGFLDNQGLYETSILVRRHTQELAAFQETWWSELKNRSVRDQLSCTYCLWKQNMEISVLPGYCRAGRNDFFKFFPHRRHWKSSSAILI